ncbi:TetR/AcrR family transcriptional regulator [Streptomyces longisporoflavus]|uniref:TetR/AcrR family transcriptional regulator n=1 Tax=Streptomyces longisporoflavus TaxID=28044 RepID=A0ABW7R1A5_9ACTN
MPAGNADDKQALSVWTRPERRRREQPALSRGQIVAEAVRLLDAEGMDALSMRKLGTRLNAGATSLYTHVANKDELIELVVDAVYGEMRVPDPAELAASTDPDGWRTATIACAETIRSTILAHPWIVSVLGETGVAHLGPNMMRLSDGMLGMLEAGGFTLEEADRAVTTLFSYVIGMTTTEAAWLTSLARSGRSEQEWVEQLRPALEKSVEAYPRLRTLYAAQRDTRASETREDNFTYGLNRVLDGLALRRKNAATDRG